MARGLRHLPAENRETLLAVCACWTRRASKLTCTAVLTMPALCCAAAAAGGDSSADQACAEITRALEQAAVQIERDYVAPVDGKALVVAAIKGMVSSLDPHSEFHDADAYARLREQLEGGFAGVGLQVGQEDGRLRVFAPIEDAPAAQAGIRADDIVTRIDDAATQGLTLTEAVRRMRGEAGTQVRLTVWRSSDDTTHTFLLTRAFIHTPSVRSSVPVTGYAYIRISGFNEQTIVDLAQHLRKLADTQPALKGLVLDLRANGGGVLQDGVGVAGAFMPAGAVIVRVEEREAGSGHVYRNIYDDYRRPSFTSDPLSGLPTMFRTLPLAVLVNAQSVSVTEVVAAALHDSGRAVLFGKPTFGKGTIQVTSALPDGSGLTLTVARYYSPSGRPIQNHGVVPDVDVQAWPGADAAELPPVREMDLAGSLPDPLDADEASLRAAHQRDVLRQLHMIEMRNARRPGSNVQSRAGAAPVAYGPANDPVLRQALRWLQEKPVVRAEQVPAQGRQLTPSHNY